MLREDREDLELENLSVTNRKCLAETRKLNAEEKKIKREALLYPFVVGAGLLTALVTLFTVLDR
ncbi:hypothetical protein NLK61_00910 [Pseudomonas fuscovaginae UPB0736]|uniref:Uncharacterized protein n=1 Tax=Pseudomonas asplenii TaxID=53407 RepID=A0A1H6NXW4_9PSED|nr:MULTISPECIES: hypothetical protein [Pseudomonas]UUQ65241.1 hypothetical protein NLK61_00910 [Pseudomonas fuscovaginae UPB0736]UZE31545.1 hypothetical protein LOY63_12760 [Pseudomonas asplenii]SDT26560.1 hypothetical protein SAMN05216598_4711 [Pseudomonas asplenii]SEI18844.1 hypothetical protein SAMN05216581_3807 [Pseudomonas fuscovaginae]